MTSNMLITSFLFLAVCIAFVENVNGKEQAEKHLMKNEITGGNLFKPLIVECFGNRNGGGGGSGNGGGGGSGNGGDAGQADGGDGTDANQQLRLSNRRRRLTNRRRTNNILLTSNNEI